MSPKNWPKEVKYSSESVAPDFNLDYFRLLLSTGQPDDMNKISQVIQNKQVYPHIKIQILTSKHVQDKRHPLSKIKTDKGDFQRGVFATKTIPENTELGEYVGEIYLIEQNQCTKLFFEKKCFSEYAWVSDIRDYFFFVDPKRVANELAFVNDYRGLQPEPNVACRWLIHRGIFYFGYVTIKEVVAGEELLVDYGEKYWVAMQKKQGFVLRQ